MSSQELMDELLDHNGFFDMLVDMIPSKLYISGQSGDDYNPSKYYRGQSEQSKEARRAANKAAKRRKLDPKQVESTVETKKRIDQELGATTTAVPSNKNNLETSVVSPNQSRIEALREKLHAKIAEKQSKRPSNPDQISKRAARRAEKLKREAKNKAKASSSTSATTATATRYTTAAEQETTDTAEDLAHVDFGRLTGLNSRNPTNYLEANKALANLNKKKDLKKLLEDAEAKRQRLEELKKGSEQEQAKAVNLQWSDAFQEADGKRVKDDPTKLKKAIKRKAVKKAKSQKAWKSRLDQVNAAQEEKQSIRNHNLNARKQGGKVGANLSKKRIVDDSEDKGRRLSRAGFEGRKQDFLNGGKE